jgi:hypothetical protein
MLALPGCWTGSIQSLQQRSSCLTIYPRPPTRNNCLKAHYGRGSRKYTFQRSGYLPIRKSQQLNSPIGNNTSSRKIPEETQEFPTGYEVPPQDVLAKAKAGDVYRYSPLLDWNCMKLVELLSGHRNDVLGIKLFPVTFGDRTGSYEALSYKWGLPRSGMCIFSPFFMRNYAPKHIFAYRWLKEDYM